MVRAKMKSAGPRVQDAPSQGSQTPMSGARFQFGQAERRNADMLLDLALEEDLGQVGDITSTATIPSHAEGGGPVRGPGAGRARRPARRRAAGRALRAHRLLAAVPGRRRSAGSRGP